MIKKVKDIVVFLGLKMFNYDKFYLYCHAAEIACHFWREVQNSKKTFFQIINLEI